MTPSTMTTSTLRFAVPYQGSDPQRPPFYTGSEPPEASVTLRCPSCDGDVVLDAWSFHTRAERWHDAMPESFQEAISGLFGLQREARTDPWPGRLRDGRRPVVGPLVCPRCDDAQLVCLDLYERQPERYVAILHGLAASARDDAAAATPELPIEGLRLALPQTDGTVLLDFLLDGPRWLSADAALELSPAFFEGEPGASDLRGIAARDGGRIDAASLHAQSVVARGLATDDIALPLSHLVCEPDEDDPEPFETAASWRPLRRIKALRLEEAIGGGFLVYGKRSDFDIDRTPTALPFRLLLSNANAGWVHKAMDSGIDAFDGPHRLAAAVIARGLHRERATPLVFKAPPLPHPPTTIDAGWWGPEGEPQAHYVAQGDTAEVLCEQLATVVARMRERRDADRADGRNCVSVVGIANAWRLELCWFDPASSSSFGDRAYSLVLRHLAGTMKEDDLEYLARRLTAAVAVRPEFGDLELFHSFKFARQWVRQG
jgi:hypothetical protein